MDAADTLVGRACADLEAAVRALEVRDAVRDVVDRVVEDAGAGRLKALETAVRVALAQLEQTRRAEARAREECRAWRRGARQNRADAAALAEGFRQEFSRAKAALEHAARREEEIESLRREIAPWELRLRDADAELRDARDRIEELKAQVEALVAVQQDLQQQRWLESPTDAEAAVQGQAASRQRQQEQQEQQQEPRGGWRFGLGRKRSLDARNGTSSDSARNPDHKAVLALEKKLESASGALAAKASAAEDLESQIEALKASRGVHAQRARELEDALDAAAAENQRLHLQISADKEVITYLDDRVANLEQLAHEASQKRADALASRQAALETDLSLARARADALADKLMAAQSDKRLLAREVRTLRASFASGGGPSSS